MNMDIPGETVRVATVKVGVVLMQFPDAAGSSCVIREDGRTVDYMLGGKEESSFSFDQAVTLETLEQVEPEILQPLAELVSCGYTGTLLIGGIHRTGKSGVSIDDDIIKYVLKMLFSHISKVKSTTFNAVSFVQFYPDDSTLDLLNLERHDLKPFHHPVLGCLVDGVCEVTVGSAEEAYALYETGRRRLADTAAPVSSRCSFLFSVQSERELSLDGAEPEFSRGRLQLVGLAGGASRTDLRGVSPLVKTVEQMELGTRTSNHLLPFLLTDALRESGMTCLLYCIPPQALLDTEVPSALALAQRVQGLVTTATYGHWCPRVTEQELRLQMQGLRKTMMSPEEQDRDNALRLAELIKILQMVKDQSWEKRLEMSEKLKNKIKQEWQSATNKRRPSGDRGADYQETTEQIKYLQDQLRQEIKAHTTEGKGSVEQVQERVTRIQQLRESLDDEMKKSGSASVEKMDSSRPLEYGRVLERRRQIQEDHEKLIQEELEKMEEELKQEKADPGPPPSLQADGVQRELLVVAGERRVLTLQLEALRAGARQAEVDLEDLHRRHLEDMQRFREESLKVGRGGGRAVHLQDINTLIQVKLHLHSRAGGCSGRIVVGCLTPGAKVLGLIPNVCRLPVAPPPPPPPLLHPMCLDQSVTLHSTTTAQ
ncbi:kinesin-like protein KIF15 isoform X1 [Gadus macrocephalus]|uniref:kinesin-like protein KIF15 isoform X1 n=1 Tax=Gadus macrocephalus TaxID=80720 RepID=UPI0028CB9BB6|nr:kinesin-like protein KIF15 isoform X1 [Gadus macrocephalus]